ncbi:hypothetical protein BaRGS_00002604 [Batillaria attramentaria]|uniref:Uncharacterized protein n=1 Tax=Batillaria attramentaria TaxID=370345 RepID=A0ABD0M2P6_9CAEN
MHPPGIAPHSSPNPLTLSSHPTPSYSISPYIPYSPPIPHLNKWFESAFEAGILIDYQLKLLTARWANTWACCGKTKGIPRRLPTLGWLETLAGNFKRRRMEMHQGLTDLDPEEAVTDSPKGRD